jgi:peptidoglycan LD-endopeptidase CwlK
VTKVTRSAPFLVQIVRQIEEGAKAMPISLGGLDPQFRQLLDQLLVLCQQEDIEMVPYFGLRTPFEQGKLWRQSRSVAQIQSKLADLRAKGAPFLAHCIDSVGPQHGPPVTNAIPGLSWHQWGEAMDCYWLRNGKAEWDTEIGGSRNGYKVYAFLASQNGLFAGGHWQSFKDWPHVQKRRAGSPNRPLTEIDREMRSRFG